MEDQAPMSPVARFFAVRAFPFFFVAMGLAFLVIGAWWIYRAVSSSSWPTAEGVIRDSGVASKLGKKGKSTYCARVRYDFEVEGRTLTGNRITFGADVWSSSRSRAQNVVARYPVGSKVSVRYLPSDPEVSVLESGFGGAVWAFLLGGFLSVLLGAVLAWFLPRIVKAGAPGSGAPPPQAPSP